MNAASPVHLAHQWWVSHRGGERVLEVFARLFPEAAISTLFLRRRALTPEMAQRTWQVSPLGRLPSSWIDHRKLLPLYPWAVRRLSAPAGTQLLLSSDAAVVKGLRKPPGCVHVCYCHSPPRYLWDMAGDYARGAANLGLLGRAVYPRVAARVRRFDRSASAAVDHFIANSAFVADRIRRHYGRSAQVVHPPVELSRFAPDSHRSGAYLVVSELVGYKRVDLAITACAQLGRRLIVVGDGPDAARLRSLASGSSVEFRGRLPDAEVAELLARCEAFLHPQVEDFGISAVEAQASGRPVIAFRAGGALETVVEGQTGVFFETQTAEALAAALRTFESQRAHFSAEACVAQAARFSVAHFERALLDQLAEVTHLDVHQLRSFSGHGRGGQ